MQTMQAVSTLGVGSPRGVFDFFNFQVLRQCVILAVGFLGAIFREKQHRANIAGNSYEVNFVVSGVSGPSLRQNVDWNVVGMVVCLRRTLSGGWEL